MFNVFKLVIAVILFFIIKSPAYWSLKFKFTQAKFDDFVATFCKYCLTAIGCTYEIIDNRTTPVDSALYISNHNSMYDSLLTAVAVKTKLSYFVAGEYERFSKLPLIKPITRWTQFIFVDRSNMRSGFESVKQGEKILNNNSNLIIFAEGEISRYVLKAGQSHIADFHAGSFKPAMLAKKPVVPITIVGSDKIHNTRNMFTPIKKAHVKIIIGEPIYFHKCEKHVMTSEMATQTRDVILNTYQQYQ